MTPPLAPYTDAELMERYQALRDALARRAATVTGQAVPQ